jgi:hypothetical protein
MRNRVMERASLATRHDFDSLSASSDVEVRHAQHCELNILANIAHRMVPGVQIAAPDLGRYLAFDPECILTFSRQNRLLGAIAFLYLNSRGHDALFHGEISLTLPDISLLAGRGDEVSATYIWAIATFGRGISGYGKVAAHLRTPRYVNANCFAQPSTKAGRDWLVATCFKQIPSLQPDLWFYERPWNRQSSRARAVNAERSFVDARH